MENLMPPIISAISNPLKGCLDSKHSSSCVTIFVNDVNLYHGKFLAQHLFRKYTNDNAKEGVKKIELFGTVDLLSNENPPPDVEICGFKDQIDLFNKVKGCDIVVYHITETHKQVKEALAVIKYLHDEIDAINCSLFILISTIATWAMTECIDEDEEDLPLTEEDFRARKPHSNFEAHLQVEKMAIKLGRIKQSLSSYVIASGLTYGMGEHIFKHLYQSSWSYKDPVPCYGNGNNILPTIHILDLAKVVAAIIDRRPRKRYVVAIDDSHNTYFQIVEVIMNFLSPGKMKMFPFTDVYLNEELTQIQIDMLGIDLKMVGFLKQQLGVELEFASGIHENVDRLVDEYREFVGLSTFKIIILGPPVSGKSTISDVLADALNVPFFNMADMKTDSISEIVKKLSLPSDWLNTKNVELHFGVGKELEMFVKLVEEIQTGTAQGLLIESEALMKLMRFVLSSKLCTTYGFVLDGFPCNINQAAQLFQELDEKDGNPTENKREIRVVLDLAPTDSYYPEFVLNLPESYFQEAKMTPMSLKTQIVQHKSRGDEHDILLTSLEKLSFAIITIEFSLMNSDVIHEIIQHLPDSCAQAVLKSYELKERSIGCNKAAIDEDLTRADPREKSVQLLSKTARMMDEERYCLDVASCSYYKYLTDKLLIECAEGIIECCANKPHDPVEFLARYIFERHG